MNILDKLEERSENERRRYPWPKLSCVSEEFASGKTRDAGFATQQQYVLQVKLNVSYWANTAEKPTCRRSAERTLINFMYQDLLVPISRLRHAVTCGDRDEAHEIMSEIEAMVR